MTKAEHKQQRQKWQTLAEKFRGAPGNPHGAGLFNSHCVAAGKLLRASIESGLIVGDFNCEWPPRVDPMDPAANESVWAFMWMSIASGIGESHPSELPAAPLHARQVSKSECVTFSYTHPDDWAIRSESFSQVCEWIAAGPHVDHTADNDLEPPTGKPGRRRKHAELDDQLAIVWATRKYADSFDLANRIVSPRDAAEKKFLSKLIKILPSAKQIQDGLDRNATAKSRAKKAAGSAESVIS